MVCTYAVFAFVVFFPTHPSSAIFIAGEVIEVYSSILLMYPVLISSGLEINFFRGQKQAVLTLCCWRGNYQSKLIHTVQNFIRVLKIQTVFTFNVRNLRNLRMLL